MKRFYPLSIYLLPIILLLIIVALVRGSNDYSKSGKEQLQKAEKPVIGKYDLPSPNEPEKEKKPEESFQSRIPVYPNSAKVKLQEDSDVTEAAFYTTTDSMDTVKDWYYESLKSVGKVSLIDIKSREGLRVVTFSFSDPPKELVEIKERYKGAKDLLITITTFDFYTRHQPRPLEPSSPKEQESKNNKGDEKGKAKNVPGDTDD